ncbi:MAG: AAA family ATPase [Acidobacteriota bacterium]|nr:AAA family ATPase [Acidobacteriota bacterium]
MNDDNLIYVSYSHKDRKWLNKLKQTAAVTGLNFWDDSQISAGALWREETQKAMNRARAALLLISPDYLASDIATKTELNVFLESAKRGDLILLWLPIRPSLAMNTPLADYQALWEPKKPLANLAPAELESALTKVVAGMVEIMEKPLSRTESIPGRKPGPGEAPFLELVSLSLENIRCFKQLDLDFRPEGETVKRMIVLGDNATGKTTVLRALALGLCEETAATVLVNHTPGPFIREGSETGTILVTLRDPVNGKSYEIKTRLRKKSGSEEVRQIPEPEPFPWPHVFVCAYGTNRAQPAQDPADTYRHQDAVQALFDYDAKLLNPELVLLRQPPHVRGIMEEKLRKMMMLEAPPDDEEYNPSLVTIRGPWGRKPIEVLSDGYRSSAQWIIDLLGRQVLARGTRNIENPSGIVLIDEIDQHLHPRWQRAFFSILKKQFPNIQFIATTHSPVMAATLGGLEDAARERVIHLTETGDGIEKKEARLRGLSSDQVLASEAFNYIVQSGDDELNSLLAEASQLASLEEGRTEDQEQRYQRVLAVIQEVLEEEGETRVERDARRFFYERLQQRVEELKKALTGADR